MLRLGGWLAREQIHKNGLRFWFNGAGNTCPGRCAEIGPKLQVRLPAWQLDRSTLDPHVLQLAAEAGCEIWRPATVRAITLGESGRHAITVTRGDGTEHTLRPRWLIDASGKAAVLARQRGTLEILAEHPTNSMWARYRDVGDLDSAALVSRCPELADRVWSQRSTATNHLTGYGWWAWIIPLKGGETSIGITWDRRLFQPPSDGPIPARIEAVLRDHPIGAYLMENARAVEKDARTYSQLAYFSREVAGPGWAAVGDAAGFMDPLYSHGIDFIAHTVWAASRMVLHSLAGHDAGPMAAAYNQGYQESYQRWFEALYKDKYHYLGDAELMYAATLMDVGFYFWGPVRLTYRNHAAELALMPYNGGAGRAVAAFMRLYNRRLATLARHRLQSGRYGRKNLDSMFIFPESFLPNHKVLGLILHGVKQWLKCEWTTWWGARFPRQSTAAATPGHGNPVPATAGVAASTSKIP